MDEERRKILTMLKNGEITIDEANALLEELEQIQTEKTQKKPCCLRSEPYIACGI